jgi:hypothetical protein
VKEINIEVKRELGFEWVYEGKSDLIPHYDSL